MQVKRFHIEGVALVIPKVHGDNRGWFVESYNERRYKEAGITCDFVQDNHSMSKRGTLRGLHYQVQNAQDKLVRCTRGRVWDVAVDVRPGSPTYGEWVGVYLDEQDHHQLFVPKGMAHGFQVLSDVAEFQYKVSDFYYPEHERGIMWDDPDLAVEWPGEDVPLLSAKDKVNQAFKDISFD